MGDVIAGNKDVGQTGRIIREWVEEGDMVLGNGEEWCEGTWTWRRGDQRNLQLI